MSTIDWSETRRERWIRRNFWFAVVALVAWEIALLIWLRVDPGRFPIRWGKHDLVWEGADHGYLVVQAWLLIAAELGCAWLYQNNRSAGRGAAALIGGFLLLTALIESLLASVRVPGAGDAWFLAWAGVSHLAYTLFGGPLGQRDAFASYVFVGRDGAPARAGAGAAAGAAASRGRPWRRSSTRGSVWTSSGGDSLAESLLARGHGDGAIELYRAQARERPDDPKPLLAIARIERLERGRPERAIQALREAGERAAGDPESEMLVLRQLAEIQMQDLGRPREAMPDLARLAATFPGTPHGEWARRELRELKVRLAAGELEREAPSMGIVPADFAQEVDVLLRTRYGLVFIETGEPERVEPMLRQLSERRLMPLFHWSPTRGLRREGQDRGVYGTESPEMALAHIDASDAHALYFLPGFADYLEGNAMLAHQLAEVAREFAEVEGAIILVGPNASLPDAVRGAAAVVRLPAPEPREYRAVLERVVRELESRMKVHVELDHRQRESLLGNLRGLTLIEAERLLTRMMVEDGRLDADDLERVVEAKRQVVEQEGLLEYHALEVGMDDIADLAGLKEWLRQRRGVLADPQRAKEFGLEFPKGILLVGVPGSGKSLCAKAVAADWHLPLLRLDPSNLYHKYVGESERNFKRALQTAERIAPAVLWIDEIEKAFAAGDADGGVSQRVLGSFLSWMQERRGDVFIVATANDIARLPAEFLRKGRFDEIFFVDLPDEEARAAIFEVHLRKRGQPAKQFDTARLAVATDGFSGAEIEQVIVAALFTAFSAGEELTTQSLMEEAAITRPLSVTMAERVAALRQWAKGRTRMA